MAQRDEVEAWVDAYAREIHAYLWRMLGDPDDAEDCLQDTFLRALRAKSGRPIRAPRAWLYAVATNTARTQLRRRRRRGDQAIDEMEDIAADDAPESVRDQVQAVRRAVERLPGKQQAALVMRRYQGLGYADIGIALETTPEAARANVYQALRKLRALFPEEAR